MRKTGFQLIGCSAVLVMLLLPIAAFSQSSGYAETPCKTAGDASEAGENDALEGGGKDTNNTVAVTSDGTVKLTCVETPQGQSSTVTFCSDPANPSDCTVLDRDSKEAENINDISKIVRANGKRELMISSSDSNGPLVYQAADSYSHNGMRLLNELYGSGINDKMERIVNASPVVKFDSLAIDSIREYGLDTTDRDVRVVLDAHLSSQLSNRVTLNPDTGVVKQMNEIIMQDPVAKVMLEQRPEDQFIAPSTFAVRPDFYAPPSEGGAPLSKNVIDRTGTLAHGWDFAVRKWDNSWGKFATALSGGWTGFSTSESSWTK